VGKCDKKNEYEIKLRNDNPFTWHVKAQKTWWIFMNYLLTTWFLLQSVMCSFTRTDTARCLNIKWLQHTSIFQTTDGYTAEPSTHIQHNYIQAPNRVLCILTLHSLQTSLQLQNSRGLTPLLLSGGVLLATSLTHCNITIIMLYINVPLLTGWLKPRNFRILGVIEITDASFTK
jgi:hypothetical protein